MEIHFEVHIETPLLHDEAKAKITNRLEKMQIPLGQGIIDPMAVLCYSAKRGGQRGVWNGVVKLHLQNPEIDGIKLLQGLCPFVLYFDIIDGYSNHPCTKKYNLGKVCKSFHNIARNDSLTVKIKSDNLLDTTASSFFHDILRNSFLKKHDFEVMDVQKKTHECHTFILAPTPNQADKIRLHHVAANHKVIMPQKRCLRHHVSLPRPRLRKMPCPSHFLTFRF